MTQDKLALLELQLQLAKEQVNQLESDLENLQKSFQLEKNRLKQIIGSWRRKAQEKGIRRDCMREVYLANPDLHFKIYEIELPPDLPIEEVLDFMKDSILKELFPYEINKVEFIPKSKKWRYEVQKKLNYDVRLDPEFYKKYFEENF